MNKEILLNKNTYNGNTVKKIINSILENLDYNQEILEKAIRSDKRNTNYETNLDEIKNIVRKYIQYEEIIKKQLNSSIKLDGIGNVAVIYENNPYITVEMAIKALYTHNNMIFYPKFNLAINACILTIFKESMKECNYNAYIDIMDIEELYQNQNIFDIAVFVGDKYEYYKFKQKFHKEIIYSAYGSAQIYVEDDSFEDKLATIDDYAYNNNIVMYYYNNQNIDDVIEEINEIAKNDIAVIFTKNKNKAKKFLEKINARKIYINENPFNNYKFEFDEKKLLIRK